MVIMDEDNSDRKFRKMILDPNVKEIGIVQTQHP